MNDDQTAAITATVGQTAALFGMPLPPESHEQVARVLAALLDSVRPLDGVVLDDAEPAAQFDPRWDGEA